MSKSIFRISILLSFFLSLTLRYLIPPYPLFGSVFDDQLMIEIAYNILGGDWLGSYESVGHRLLSKPPGYAIYLVLTSWMPLAPTVTVHLTLLVGLAIVTRELRQLGITRGLALCFFCFVSFYPIWFNEPMSRIYRDGFLAALSALTLGLCLMTRRQLVMYQSRGDVNLWPSPLRLCALLATPLFIGVTLSWFIITKNSWHFLVAMSVFVIGSPLKLKYLKSRQYLTVLLAMVGVLAMSCSVVITGVVLKNDSKYGVRRLDTFTEGPFADTMRALYSVSDTENRPFVDISKKTRLEVYKVSPTFARLQPFLEIPDGTGWRAAPCQSGLGICDESAAWFAWDLRDAVGAAGLGSSAIEFLETFSSIEDEVRAACNSGELKCESAGLAPGVDSLNSLSPRILLNSIVYGLGDILNPDTGRAERPIQADVKPRQNRIWNRVVNGLPPITYSSRYEANSVMLVDARRVLGEVYGVVWPIVAVVGLVGLFVGLLDRRSRAIAMLGIVVGVAACVFIVQLSLVEASSGIFMIPGGQMYMLCLYPLIFTSVGLGLHTVLSKLWSR